MEAKDLKISYELDHDLKQVNVQIRCDKCLVAEDFVVAMRSWLDRFEQIVNEDRKKQIAILQ